MDSRKYIGMDVHQASISVAVRDGAGKVTMECILETKAATILEFLGGLRPFIEHLATSPLSSKTIRRHVDNLWVLGGEIIRDLHYEPSRRKLAADRLLRDAVQEDGGPLVHNGSEEEQRSFDSTCRKLHRFLSDV